MVGDQNRGDVSGNAVCTYTSEGEDAHPHRDLQAQRKQQCGQRGLNRQQMSVVEGTHVRRTSLFPKTPRGRSTRTAMIRPKEMASTQRPLVRVRTTTSDAASASAPTAVPSVLPTPPRMTTAKALISRTSPVSGTIAVAYSAKR